MISKQNARNDFLADGITRVWNFDFDVWAGAGSQQIKLFVKNDDGSVDEIVNGFSVDFYNKTVTYPNLIEMAAVPANKIVIIARYLPKIQPSNFQSQQAYTPKMVENALDYEMMITQQINDCIENLIDGYDVKEGDIVSAVSQAKSAAAAAETSSCAAAACAANAEMAASSAQAYTEAIPEVIQPYLDEKASKNGDFISELTDDNKGATSAEIDAIVNETFSGYSFWFGKATSDFTPPPPTSANQNYFDFSTMTKYSALPDLSGWGTPQSVVVENNKSIKITSAFWDITDAGYPGTATYNADTGWSYFPQKSGVGDGETIAQRVSDGALKIKDIKVPQAIVNDNEPFNAGADYSFLDFVTALIGKTNSMTVRFLGAGNPNIDDVITTGIYKYYITSDSNKNAFLIVFSEAYNTVQIQFATPTGYGAAGYYIPSIRFRRYMSYAPDQWGLF